MDWTRFFQFIVSILFACLIFGVLMFAHSLDKERVAAKENYKAACIDAGGYPVVPFDYVKGTGYKPLCINPGAIIELKDDL